MATATVLGFVLAAVAVGECCSVRFVRYIAKLHDLLIKRGIVLYMYWRSKTGGHVFIYYIS